MKPTTRGTLGTCVLVLSCLAAPASVARNVLDQLGRDLTFTAENGRTWARLSGMADLAVYEAEAPPPGLLFSDASPLLAPRLSLMADAGFGSRVMAHALVRADRGFDPGAESNGDVRFDEYFLQADILDAVRGRLRIGKFATAFGDWVPRHLAWDNPLITAPAIYEDMVTVKDAATPPDVAEFLGRRDQPEKKSAWLPAIWGPSYATGASLSLGVGAVDVVVEAKNAALSSRPATWDDWDRPTGMTVTGRINWHPQPEWRVGASFSEGPYLRQAAADTLPAGADLDDYEQRTLGLDLTFERHQLQLWAELVHSRFDVPRVGAADMVGGFLEMRYKLSPRWWLAGRWNQSWFDDVAGSDQGWERDLWRADLVVGFRHSAHVEAKVEYSTGHQQGGNVNGNRLLVGQLVVWF